MRRLILAAQFLKRAKPPAMWSNCRIDLFVTEGLAFDHSTGMGFPESAYLADNSYRVGFHGGSAARRCTLAETQL